MAHSTDVAFPCTLTLHIPLPTPLASIALHALAVDQELSPLVRRSFALTNPSPDTSSDVSSADAKTILQVSYAATTNRMLRVAVNGFFESVGVVLGVMEELDVDVLDVPGKEGLEGVQGVERVPG
ncbi:Pcc1-domain-containing protein [Lepidopterella palustris CBS 459.81]|uniref:Pcc1-domain-containing protein n=1 Tax=Lepidopterella palustris CBS 459.81 TaxID=1314670 RepID=A0A8E2EEU6_9PEZI|nr:Pcc1-domain-containing protein [Lepidopterella palustris CBS 459.81]